MKKFFFYIVAFVCFSIQAVAQKALELKKQGKNFYIEHKVAAKQTYYGISKMYNASQKSIADFNGVSLDKALQINQTLKIPLTKDNFKQEGNSGAPVYYFVNTETTLAQVASNVGATAARLQEWNNKTGNSVKKGEKLLVGFLKGSQLASITVKPSKPTNTPVEEKKEEVIAKSETPVVSKEEPKVDVPIKTEPVNNPVTTKLEEVYEEETPPVVEKDEMELHAGKGYFKAHYIHQIKEAAPRNDKVVTSGIFKTISGWADGKYYLLIDNVHPGTIVKLTNPSNNQTIYAKVLGNMSGIKQNEGYDIRISSAAANALDAVDSNKFVVNVVY